jgi:hypothetical protein
MASILLLLCWKEEEYVNLGCIVDLQTIQLNGSPLTGSNSSNYSVTKPLRTLISELWIIPGKK